MKTGLVIAFVVGIFSVFGFGQTSQPTSCPAISQAEWKDLVKRGSDEAKAIQSLPLNKAWCDPATGACCQGFSEKDRQALLKERLVGSFYLPLLNKLETGMVGVYVGSVTLEQKIDDTNSIVEIYVGGTLYDTSQQKKRVWLQGFRHSKADGDDLQLSGKVFKVTGTKTCTTVIGGSRTIYVIEQVDISEQLKPKSSKSLTSQPSLTTEEFQELLDRGYKQAGANKAKPEENKTVLCLDKKNKIYLPRLTELTKGGIGVPWTGIGGEDWIKVSKCKIFSKVNDNESIVYIGFDEEQAKAMGDITVLRAIQEQMKEKFLMSKTMIYVKNFPQQHADGEEINTGNYVFKVVGTTTYLTAIGGSNTIYQVEAIDVTPYIAAYLKTQKATEKPKQVENRPASELKLAKLYIDNNMQDKAREKLESLIKTYPDSPEAIEAKKLLADQTSRPTTQTR